MNIDYLVGFDWVTILWNIFSSCGVLTKQSFDKFQYKVCLTTVIVFKLCTFSWKFQPILEWKSMKKVSRFNLIHVKHINSASIIIKIALTKGTENISSKTILSIRNVLFEKGKEVLLYLICLYQ